MENGDWDDNENVGHIFNNIGYDDRRNGAGRLCGVFG
jgi:hypothetical protein